jgi:hypothetical protein
VAWWDNLKINALVIAKGLWEQSRLKANPTAAQASQQQALNDSPEASQHQNVSKLPNEAN